MTIKTPITVAYGDGIGPEIMQATIDILTAAGAQIDVEVIEVGEKVYREGYSSGIPDDAWRSLKRTKVLPKKSHYHPARWWLQKLKCDAAQNIRSLCQCTSLCFLCTLRTH